MEKIKLVMTLPIDYVETLQGFIDGGIGTSDSDEFSKQMKSVLKKLDKEVKRYYKEKNIATINGVIKSKQTIYI